MTTVLVTGGGERLTEVASALERAGVETVVVDTPDRLGTAVEGRSFAGYVQLPVAMTPTGGTLVSKVERVKFLHIVEVNVEVINLRVLTNTLGMRRLRQRRKSDNLV